MRLMKNLNMKFDRGSGKGLDSRNATGDRGKGYCLCDDDMIKLKILSRYGTELINVRVTVDDLEDKFVYKIYIDGDEMREMWDFTKSDPKSKVRIFDEYDLVMDIIGG